MCVVNKRLVIIALLLIVPLVAVAQFEDFFRNSFLSAGGGASLYYHDGDATPAASAELTYGKWLLTTVGLRGQIDYQYVLSDYNVPFLYGHGDIFFDPLTAFRGRNPSDNWRSWFFVGIGLVHKSGDNDFIGSAGLGTDCRIAKDWRLYAELRAMIHPSAFDHNQKSSGLYSLSLGVERDIMFNPTRARARHETQSFLNDWFIQVALGANSMQYNGVENVDRLRYAMPIIEAGLGKRINTTWAVRFQASGLYAKYQSMDRQSYGDPLYEDVLFSYVHFHGDLALDCIGLFTRRLSSFQLLPYAGMGAIFRSDNVSNYLFCINGGTLLSYRLPWGSSELFLDARYLMMQPRFIVTDAHQGSFSVGMFSLSLGYSYHLTKSSIR